MKKFKHLLVAVSVMFGLVASSAFADHDVGKLPVTRGMLKAYAMSAAVSANASVYGEAIIQDSRSQTYREVAGEGIDELIKGLGQKPFIFSINNPKSDVAYAYASVVDKKGRQLFWAWQKISFEQDQNGNWYSPQGAFYEFDLVDPVPIEIDGVQSARVIVRDDSGKLVRSEYLKVEDGAVYMSSSFNEQVGEIVLNRYLDDQWVVEVYNLATGTRMYSTTMMVWPWGVVKNAFRLVNDQESVRFGPIARDTVFTMSASGQVMTTVLVYDENNSRLPIGLRVSDRNQSPRLWYFVPRPDGDQEIKIPFPKGEWDIVPDWELPPESERLNRLPYQYGVQAISVSVEKG